MKITTPVAALAILTLLLAGTSRAAECTQAELEQGGKTRDFINGSKICVMPESKNKEVYVCDQNGCELRKLHRTSDTTELPRAEAAEQEI